MNAQSYLQVSIYNIHHIWMCKPNTYIHNYQYICNHFDLKGQRLSCAQLVWVIYALSKPWDSTCKVEKKRSGRQRSFLLQRFLSFAIFHPLPLNMMKPLLWLPTVQESNCILPMNLLISWYSFHKCEEPSKKICFALVCCWRCETTVIKHDTKALWMSQNTDSLGMI